MIQDCVIRSGAWRGDWWLIKLFHQVTSADKFYYPHILASSFAIDGSGEMKRGLACYLCACLYIFMSEGTDKWLINVLLHWFIK